MAKVSKRAQIFQDDLDAADGLISSLIGHCIAASTHGEDGISLSTIAIEHLSRGHSALLLARSNSLKQDMRIEEAILDALKAIEIEPTSVEGYLAAGDLYSSQGKQQAAINIYEQGLRIVSPSKRALLDERRGNAIKLLDRRIDFVEYLPVEVASQIVTPWLDSEDCADLIFVSKRWNNFFLDKCPDLWEVAHISPDPCTAVSLFRNLPSMGKHVRSLTVDYVASNILGKLCWFAKNHQLPSITRLELTTLPSSVEQYMQLVSLLAATLKDIKIYFYDTYGYDDALDLDKVFSMCTNLENLHLDSNTTINYQPQKKTSSRLVSFAIRAPDNHRLFGHTTFPKFPQLQELTISYVKEEEYDLIHYHCPQLRSLEIDRNFVLFGFNDTNLYDNCNDEPGLFTLKHSVTSEAEYGSVFFFDRHRSTLKFLECTISPGQTRFMPDEVVFTQLSTLCLYVDVYEEDEAEKIAYMISRCPALQKLDLEVTNERTPTSSLITCLLESSPLLETLQLSRLKTPSIVLCRLFSHYAARHQECKLQNVSFSRCENITGQVLDTLADIATLQSIDFSRSMGSVTEDEIVSFIRKLHSLPHLKELSLSFMPKITDAIVAELVQINGLQGLTLYELDAVTSDGLERAWKRRASSLKKEICYGYFSDMP